MRKNSIITKDWSQCYRCGYPIVDEHHCIEGSYRHLSEKYGLVMPLCRQCHKLAHSDTELSDTIHTLAQKRFEKHYPNLDWMEIFKINYKSIYERKYRK